MSTTLREHPAPSFRMMQPTMESLEANVQIGDFQIVRRLGAGGMGIVYLARQLSLNRLVALKVLGTALTDRSEIARFQREAQAVARLDHPGIARIHFIGQDREVCYIVMEYIDGASLREVLKLVNMSHQPGQSMDAVLRATQTGADEPLEVRFDQETAMYSPEPQASGMPVDSGSLTPEAEKLKTAPVHVRRCCVIVREAALALAHAHERGVIHRDLKPENLLLDRLERVHVIDFGLARFFEDVTLTNTGALVGTPLYMSPEQVSGRVVVDHRTDVYSLGMVLYELLTLRRPITAPTREGVLRHVVTKALPPVSRLNRSVSRDLESVVHQATAKDPDDRYQSALALAEDLDNVLAKKPVMAKFYRYRFDEKEIAAERPREIIFISFAFMLMALSAFFVSCWTASSRWGIRANTSDYLLDMTIAFASMIFGGLCFISSCFILTGRKWARLMTAITCIIVGSCSLAGSTALIYYAIEALRDDRSGTSRLTSILPSLIMLFVSLLPILLIPLLYRRGIKNWFDFSERLRAEHKQEG